VKIIGVRKLNIWRIGIINARENGEKMKEDFLKSISCLDKGFVRLVDYMGDDAAIVQAARVSYGEGTKAISEDKGLIRYLLNKKHTSPFEQVEFKFHVKAPIFVFRQWHRHRCVSINELSARYSEMKDECYLPNIEDIKLQSKDNKQCRDDSGLSHEDAFTVLEEMKLMQEDCFIHYRRLLDLGIARELARINLPVSTYSEMYWKIDLHNLFHFLKLRMDPHAQMEIRVFANALYELIKPIVPIASEAFEEYSLYAKTLSLAESNTLCDFLKVSPIKNLLHLIDSSDVLSKREKKEMKEKLGIV